MASQAAENTNLQGLAPAGVAVADQGEALSVTWADGHRSLYTSGFLRGACPCATCKGDHRPRDIDKVEPVEGVQLIDYLPMGTYAIRLMFSDAHDTGIYSYDYLRTLCQCQECA